MKDGISEGQLHCPKYFDRPAMNSSYQNESVKYPYKSGYPQDEHSGTKLDIANSETHDYNHRQLNTFTPIEYTMSINTKVEDLPEPYVPNFDCPSVVGENFANSSFDTSPSSYGIYDGCWSGSSIRLREVVDDLTTSLDTMKEVASAIETKPHEDHMAATCEELTRSSSGSLINTRKAERGHKFDDEQSTSQYQTHNKVVGLSQISCGTKKKRKIKLYQLGPQENKELEIKRLRALQAHRNRERMEREERLAKVTIRKMEDEIQSLRKEKEDRRYTVSLLEAQLSGLVLDNRKNETNTTHGNDDIDGGFAVAYPE
ncbi:uncharacterized protein [Palaemon carinicauda]|uniref:uncharacterized protein n=1 Tax=Palaemon carinicauda TaxID=392227 RepID=UPI0035B59A23